MLVKLVDQWLMSSVPNLKMSGYIDHYQEKPNDLYLKYHISDQ